MTVDDIMQELAPTQQRPGPAPQFGDSELLTICLIAEYKGWDMETGLLSNMTVTVTSVQTCLSKVGSTGDVAI